MPYHERSNEQIIITTKPSIKTISFGLIGTLFFAALAYLMLSMKWTVADGTNYKTGMTIMSIILGVFVFFSLGCIWIILNIKTIILTTKTLIIRRPFLLIKKSIPIDSIKEISETSFKINPMVKGTSYNVYEGKQILIDFHKGRSMKLNSFEIPEYYSLLKALIYLEKLTTKRIPGI